MAPLPDIDDKGTFGLKHGRSALRCNRHFVAERRQMVRVDAMRLSVVSFAIALAFVAPAHARAEVPKAAVFDFDLIDTSLEGEMKGARADEKTRLARAGDQLRKGLADSGKFIVVDIAPIEAEAQGSNLPACGRFAGDLGQASG